MNDDVCRRPFHRPAHWSIDKSTLCWARDMHWIGVLDHVRSLNVMLVSYRDWTCEWRESIVFKPDGWKPEIVYDSDALCTSQQAQCTNISRYLYDCLGLKHWTWQLRASYKISNISCSQWFTKPRSYLRPSWVFFINKFHEKFNAIHWSQFMILQHNKEQTRYLDAVSFCGKQWKRKLNVLDKTFKTIEFRQQIVSAALQRSSTYHLTFLENDRNKSWLGKKWINTNFWELNVELDAQD